MIWDIGEMMYVRTHLDNLQCSNKDNKNSLCLRTGPTAEPVFLSFYCAAITDIAGTGFIKKEYRTTYIVFGWRP